MRGIKLWVVVCALGCGAAWAQSSDEGLQSSVPMMAFQGVAEGGSYLGVFVAEIDAQRAKALKLPEERGVEITRVEPGSPAEKAGLKSGDVVLGYGGEQIEGMKQFQRIIRETPAGRHVNLSIFRNGAPQTIPVVIGAMKSAMFHFPEGGALLTPQITTPDVLVPDLPQILSGARSPVLGVETEPLSPQLASFFGVSQGVLVRSVLHGSAAEKAGIKAGDIITKADDMEIGDPGRLSMAVRSAFMNQKPIALKLVRNKQQMSMTVTLEPLEPHYPQGQVVRQPEH